MSCDLQQTAEYRCPGQPYPISRSVHLGRLARFYPGCRQCPHRDDTGTLSQRQVARLTETQSRGLPRSLFHEEGAGGDLNDFDPPAARQMAASLGVCLQRENAVCNVRRATTPVTAIGSDGRSTSCRLVAAVVDGLRWAGCDVVDVGATTAPCLAAAIDKLPADGGVLVGQPGHRPHAVGLKFWAGGPRPLSAGGGFESLRQVFDHRVDRPARTYGSLRRFQAEMPYLAALTGHYHALRPLRLVMNTCCDPLLRYLTKLTEPVACRIIPRRAATDQMPAQVSADKAHFAVQIDDDGERSCFFDEQGREISAEPLLLLVARHLLANASRRCVVLEEGTAPAVARTVESLHCQVVLAGGRRAAMERAMREHGAGFGGGPSGRFWYAHGDAALPDALATLSLLLVILSQSDRRLSEVVDAASKSA